MKRCFDHVVRQDLAYSERVLRQYSDKLLHWNDFDVLLNAAMLSARKMASIRHPWFATRLSINEFDLDDARMELWNSCQIHAVRPHCFQWRVDDDPLPGSKRWSQSCLQILRGNQWDQQPALLSALRQHPVHQVHRDRSLTHGRRHALDVARAHIACGKHARQAGFQQIGRS